MVLQRVWELRTPTDRALSAALLPVSYLYALGWLTYSSVYALGLKKRFSPSIPVIGVGNLEVGGLGKTPCAIAIARLFEREGVRVGVSASGYGSPAAQAAQLAPAGPLSPREWGDEPSLIRSKLPDLPLIVGRRRVLAAQIAEKEGLGALVLDDGFQHLPLGRVADLLLWDPDGPNRRCLPAGPMREPTLGAKRATAVLIGDDGDPPYDMAAFRLRRVFTGLVSLTGEQLPVEWLAGRELRALCAIGRPRAFFETLRKLGARLVDEVALADHDPLDRDLPPGAPWIVTEKDAVKLRGRAPANPEIYALQMDIEFTEEEKLAEWLRKLVGA